MSTLYLKYVKNKGFPQYFPCLTSCFSKIYRRVFNTQSDCGNQDISNITDPDYKKWDLEG